MADNIMDTIVAELKATGASYYPECGELRNVRIVGHTPKSDHYIYDLVIDFANGSQRVAAKVYRGGKAGAAKALASEEAGNLERVYAIFQKRKLSGVPRPIGNFTELGAVVTEKFTGLPLQSIIMKAALLPGYADRGTLKTAARKTGEWLRSFHRATSDMPAPFDSEALVKELERVCERCKREGLDDNSIANIVSGARHVLAKVKKALPSSAVLNDFTPLNVVVGEQGIGICDYAKMTARGTSLQDVAMFLASVEALEKYPFCNRSITQQIEEEFLDAYGVSATDMAVLRVLKMKILLSMFAHGRNVKESALRKKIMWANVMKKFIHQAAQRALAQPAA